MSRLVVKSGGAAGFEEWRACFAEVAPGLDVRFWDEMGDPGEVDFALVWDPEPGRLAAMPGLRCIFGAGAGVDLIVRDPDFPRHVPLVRMTPAGAAQRMGEYICWAALHVLRQGRRMALAQARGAWDYFDCASAAEVRVGVMGLGVMGSRAAVMLQGLGFAVHGWSRSAKCLPGVKDYVGEGALDDFLAASDLLVCLLPDTPDTRGILARPLFEKLPRGAMLINAGRGAQQNLDDVLAALDEGLLAGAVLDVFEPEPLAEGHPAWAAERLTITPHVASLPPRRERAEWVAACIAGIEAGRWPEKIYNPDLGY